MLGGAWIAVAGVDGVRQVVSFRDATGWQVESLPGVLWHLRDPSRIKFESGAFRTGIMPLWARPLLTLLSLVAVVGAFSTAVSVTVSVWLGSRGLAVVDRWKRTAMPTPRETVEAWRLASTFTLRQYRRLSGLVGMLSVAPTVATARSAIVESSVSPERWLITAV